ncbi:MAG: hypothetical protein OEM25_09250 [Gammaproteobacteria bacterium]|nr:hypothetical protein [Gammaproteobacteria bacterium]
MPCKRQTKYMPMLSCRIPMAPELFEQMIALRGLEAVETNTST